MKLAAPPLKIYFVSGTETAVFRPDLATKKALKDGLLTYEYIATELDPRFDTKIGKTVDVSLEQLQRLLEINHLKVL